MSMKSLSARAEAPVRADARRRPRRLPRRWWVGYLFLAPALALFVVLGLYCVVFSLGLSFVQWDGLSPTWTWVGLDNFTYFLYRDSATADLFRASLLHNFILAAVVPISSCLVGLGLALLLNRSGRVARLFRTIYYLPAICAGVATLYTWQLIYQPGGALDGLFRALHLSGLTPYDGWLGTPQLALPAVMVVLVWGGTAAGAGALTGAPAAMLMYLAGLQTIDREVLEAAQIDGASGWVRLRSIIWPLLFPTTVILMILNLDGVIQDYGTTYLLTNGGPANATSLVGLQVFNYATQIGNGGGSGGLGVGAALGWTLALLTFVLAMLNLRLFRSRT